MGSDARAVRAYVYGFCPTCYKPGITRERRIDGNDRCEAGHTYKSALALSAHHVSWVLAKDAEIERLKAELGKRCIAHGKMSATIVALEAQLAAMGQQAGNVLARIHGDGGHYITQHGWEKACVDADAVVCRLQAQLAASEEKRKVRVVLRSESKYVGMKILNWDTDAPILANPSKYETLRPGQSLVIMEADATDAASALEAP